MTFWSRSAMPCLACAKQILKTSEVAWSSDMCCGNKHTCLSINASPIGSVLAAVSYVLSTVDIFAVTLAQIHIRPACEFAGPDRV